MIAADKPGALPAEPRERNWTLADGLRRLLVDHGIRNGLTGCGLTVPRRGTDDGQAHAVFRCEKAWDGRRAIAVDNLGWCGSARCPRCARLVAEKLQDRVGAVLDAAEARGIGVAFVTLTAAHDHTTALADQRHDFSEIFRKMQGQSPWRREGKRGLIGAVKLWETTAGPYTGWHHHGHVLVLHRDGQDAALAVGEKIIGWWQSALRRRGWHTIREAQDVRPITSAKGLPDYGTKAMTGWGAAAELAQGWHKQGKRPGRLTLPQLLGLAVAGDTWAADRYAEAVTALSGLRLLVVGPIVAKALGIAPVAVADGDEVKPEKRPGEELGMVRAEVWNRLGRRYARAWAFGTVSRLTAQGVVWEDVAELLTRRAFGPATGRADTYLDTGGDPLSPPRPDEAQNPGPCSARAGGEAELNRDGPRPDTARRARRAAEGKGGPQAPGDTRSAMLRREHGEDAEDRTFPAVSTVASAPWPPPPPDWPARGAGPPSD
jgi:hypothetical protein